MSEQPSSQEYAILTRLINETGVTSEQLARSLGSMSAAMRLAHHPAFLAAALRARCSMMVSQYHVFALLIPSFWKFRAMAREWELKAIEQRWDGDEGDIECREVEVMFDQNIKKD